ncbi:hypothetical protein Nepgr_029569 [Nepenthes gracilis]|uniref:TAFII28-like protein domain-containing protein n=1 Tax=Nepenthes gracilis TaxID=150966 RepID=A0AAD3TF61_NEPGR|nr:hypothetical protein Nepgr_029569 [Nepenthes gracilis]
MLWAEDLIAKEWWNRLRTCPTSMADKTVGAWYNLPVDRSRTSFLMDADDFWLSMILSKFHWSEDEHKMVEGDLTRKALGPLSSSATLLRRGHFPSFFSGGEQMKQSQDPFEAAFEEQEESPPDSPLAVNDIETQVPASSGTANRHEDDSMDINIHSNVASISAGPSALAGTTMRGSKVKEDDEEEEEENMDVELGKFPSAGDPDKMAKMQSILSQFTEEQMGRYESFRRSGFQKSNMKRLLASITGSQKISVPMTIVVSGIAKMFVGELVETARMVMTERKESGPIRPCHALPLEINGDPR